MSYLSEVPVEVLLENLLPILPTPDLLRLARTSKLFADLCDDETLWHKKLLADFNFSGARTARSSGWKFIYSGMSNPKTYVWGDRRNGRLGLSKFPSNSSVGVSFPVRLRLPGVRIVDIVAGGWCFHALDSEGNIYAWGTLNSERMALRTEGYSESGKTAHTPIKLKMPAPTRTISCGRMHCSTLDANNKIWNFVSWGRPFRLSSPVFDDPEFIPIQVECGWMFSCALVKSGDVFVWWPFSGTMEQRIQVQNREMNNNPDTLAPQVDHTVPCAVWDLDVPPVRLPSLPHLPELEESLDGKVKETKLIKIAGLDGHIIGLTNKGHVVKFRGVENETTAGAGHWTYLPKYSEASLIWEQPGLKELKDQAKDPESLRITHITANFLTFVAYSTGSNSVILMGDTDTTEESDPKVVPALQNKGVISVVLGDYHRAALTSEGKLFTWGSHSNGALGLTGLESQKPGPISRRVQHVYDPPPVNVPTEVRFDHLNKQRKDKFCIAVAAGGWHTGALVIDLEPGSDESDEEIVREEREPPRPSRVQHEIQEPGSTPPFVPLPGIFRLGFPGRFRRGASQDDECSDRPGRSGS
ncbi:hypothetical protein AMATHDRAFT_153212 [Amanita thiersii Skay4041]|uniref:F-box domain-containing protein n=1 Tax=Amanita thiersii Skay4041 TaxID=703135 RepID=A0A2A9N8D9_9AGAR|nr:hypothetical protein AMATHDRAFT_153212 [Amanita thiersii Skay4041]